MKKIGRIAMTIFLVGFLYVLIILFQPTTNSIIDTANTTANWSAHSSFPLAQAALVGWPFWVYLIPVSIGTIVVVSILKGEG